MARPAPVVRQMDAAVERGLEHRPRLRRLDAPVVDALGEDDEVAREAVAADVRRLPGPAVLDLLAHRVVERAAVLGAAAVVLAVRADEEERVIDGRAGSVESRRRSARHAARARAGGPSPRSPPCGRRTRAARRGRVARLGGRRGSGRAAAACARRADAPSAPRSASTRRQRRAPRARGTRSGSRCRRGSRLPRAAPRARPTSPHRETYSSRTRQITCPLATASPASDRQPGDPPGPVGDDLVLHLHRLDDADHLAGLDLFALGDLDLQHRALHRGDDRLAAGAAGSVRSALAPAARQLRPGRLRLEHRHVVAAPADLDRPSRARGRARSATTRPAAPPASARRHAARSPPTRRCRDTFRRR